jgi:hypothetical protein
LIQKHGFTQKGALVFSLWTMTAINCYCLIGFFVDDWGFHQAKEFFVVAPFYAAAWRANTFSPLVPFLSCPFCIVYTCFYLLGLLFLRSYWVNLLAVLAYCCVTKVFMRLKHRCAHV